MSAADHIEQIHEQGWTRINTAPGEWVALVLNTENSAFGGTLYVPTGTGTARIPIS